MTPTPKRKFVIRRADQVEALASPVRQEIVATMERLGPCAARELAARLGREPESLYYHLRKLVAVGLVREAGKRPVGRRSEAVFTLVARDIAVDPKSRSARFLEMVARSASALLRLTERSYVAALEDPASVRHGPRCNLQIRRHHARLSPRAIAEINRRLDDLSAYVLAHDDPKQERFYSVTVAMSPEAKKGAGHVS